MGLGFHRVTYSSEGGKSSEKPKYCFSDELHVKKNGISGKICRLWVQGLLYLAVVCVLVLLRRCLQVVRQTDFADQLLLGFEPVDVFFVDVFLFFQQITADVVLLLFRDGDSSNEGIVFFLFFCQIAGQDFLG